MPEFEAETIPKQLLSKDAFIDMAKELEPEDESPVFVGISGYGGTGKSRLAKDVATELGDGTVVVPIDDFIRGAQDEVSSDWHTFDRVRLRREVIRPAIIGQKLQYPRYNSGDMQYNRGGRIIEIEVGNIVIIEGCGIFHPHLMAYFGLSGWIDMSQDQALQSAKGRDAQDETDQFTGQDTNALWNNVWGPNDRAFFNIFRPDRLADVLIEPQF